MESWSLPPGWGRAYSKSQNREYFYKLDDPKVTQWHEPLWDDIVARGYAQTQTADASSAAFRALQNWIKQCLLFCWIWSKDTQSVLDVACGKGGDTGKVPASVEYLGIDLCPENIATATARHPTREFCNGSFNDPTAFAACTKGRLFDAAFCMFALHYASNLRDVLRRIRASLKSGAPFVFTTFHEERLKDTPSGRGSIQIIKQEKQFKQHRVWVRLDGSVNTLPEFVLDKEMIEHAARDAGFAIEHSMSFGEAMTSFGVRQNLDATEYEQRTRRDALYWIRDTFYSKFSSQWSAEVWHMADLYKAVCLRAV